MKMNPRRPALTLAGLLLVAAAVTAPLSAQGVRSDGPCRCVDADGNTIERCSCFRTPRADDLVGALTFGDQRPRLGISVDQQQGASYDAEGALVTDVLEDGPADAAGIRQGDVITSIDGRSLQQSLGSDRERSFDLDGSMPVQRLLAVARDLEPGEEVEIEYLRNGEPGRATLEAEDLSDSWGNVSIAIPRWNQSGLEDLERGLDAGPNVWRFKGPGSAMSFGPGGMHVFGPDGGGFGGVAGLELVEVNPGLGAYFGTDRGVLVTRIDRRSGLGLQEGDVVLRIGTREVTDPERFQRILGSYGAEEDIEFLIMRDGAETTVTGRLRY